MTNREWLLNKMQNMSDEEFAETYDICAYIKEDECCVKKTATCCYDCELAWLKAEHKEKITLSEAERIILENIDKEFKWISRDENGCLWLYGGKPIKKTNAWINEISKIGSDFILFNHLFQFITWEDTEPYNIVELLKGE